MDRPHLKYNGPEAAKRFAFEENFDVIAWTDFLREYRLLIIPISAMYIFLVFSGRRWMEHRPAYRLKGPLILWNILLGGFSLSGVWRCLPMFSKAVLINGWHSSVCNEVYYHKEFVGIWGLFFTLSKIPELGDTLFVVLRKQKLMFLHWYHHATVPLFVVAFYSDLGAPGVWFTVMNYFVHGLMYPYYGLRAAGFRLPKCVAMAITALQIVQMLMGNVLVIYAAVMRYSGETNCHVGQGALALAIALYFSYLVLFALFFYSAYLGSKPTKTDANVGLSNGVKVQKVNAGIDQGIRKREFDRNENGVYTKNGKI